LFKFDLLSIVPWTVLTIPKSTTFSGGFLMNKKRNKKVNDPLKTGCSYRNDALWI
jgi:hypothetical protein